MLYAAGNWYKDRRKTQPPRYVFTRPIGGNFFKIRQYKIQSGGVQIELQRELAVKRFGFSNDLLAFAQTKKHFGFTYDLNAYQAATKKFNLSFDLNSFSEAVKHYGLSFDLKAYEPAVKHYGFSNDLLTFDEVIKHYGFSNDILAFESVIKHYGFSNDLNAYQSATKHFGLAFDLNAYEQVVKHYGFSNNILAFTPVIKHYGFSNDLLAFVTVTKHFGFTNDFNAYEIAVKHCGFTYDFETYQQIVKHFGLAYDLLANEAFYTWVMNLENAAVSKYENFNFNSISPNYACGADGIYLLGGTSDNGTAINGFAETGKLDFKTSQLKRALDVYAAKDGGKVTVNVKADDTDIPYTLRATDKLETVKANLARGVKDRVFQFKISNVEGSQASVSDVEVNLESLSRKI